jgi:hypothetical protein
MIRIELRTDTKTNRQCVRRQDGPWPVDGVSDYLNQSLNRLRVTANDTSGPIVRAARTSPWPSR